MVRVRPEPQTARQEAHRVRADGTILRKERKSAKRMFSSVLLFGRIATFCVGFAVVLALTVGVATNAAAANGKPFLLGKANVATKVTNLVKRGVGPALGLKVGADQAPLTVNAEAGTATNLSADELDGKSSEDFAPAYERIVVVGPAGSASESGASLKAALAGINDASESKPYLLKLEPGVYDLGAGWMEMKEWVDIEGSGEGVTRITGRSRGRRRGTRDGAHHESAPP